jgi:valyl-tRNA synthetase
MPFVTEEIWQKMPGSNGSIMVARYPTSADGRFDPEAEAQMALVQGVIAAIRNIRGEMNVPPSMEVETYVMTDDRAARELLAQERANILKLVRGKGLEVTPPGEKPKGAAAAVFGPAEVFVRLKGLINFEAEARRLEKEIEKAEKEIGVSSKKLSNEGFLNKAPSEVVARERDKLAKAEERNEKLVVNLVRVQDLRE